MASTRTGALTITLAAAVVGACLVGATRTLHAQQPPAQGGRGGAGAGGAGGLGAFPQRPLGDPEAVARGKALYGVNCQFCHGADTRGGDQGPSLLRSQVVQDDRSGEAIIEVVRNGRPPRMPKFNFTEAQVSDIAAFLHSFTVSSRDPARLRPPSILTGDASAGEVYFKAKCGSCHSVTGDLKSLSIRFPDPRNLQQWWLLPGAVGARGRGPDPAAANLKPVTATITLRTGQKFEGRLVRIDEFNVSVVEPDGTTRSFQRDGETPFVEVHDPLEPHKQLLRVYSDKDIHDVTAYLVKLP